MRVCQVAEDLTWLLTKVDMIFGQPRPYSLAIVVPEGIEDG